MVGVQTYLEHAQWSPYNSAFPVPLPKRRPMNNLISPEQFQVFWVGCLIITWNFSAFWRITAPSSSGSSGAR